MLKINYRDKNRLKSDYLSIFQKSASEMQKSWDILRDQLTLQKVFPTNFLPISIKTLLTADFDLLAEIYFLYSKCQKIKNSKLHESAKRIFNYSWQPYGTTFQSDISKFFMEHCNLVDLSTCYYCNMAYINVYNNILSTDTDQSLLDFLNTATKDELLTNIGYAESTIDDIIQHRSSSIFLSGVDFDSRHIKRKVTFSQIRNKISAGVKNHFDLDHFLDKESCPLLALSLFNFVPSCQVCNEKLKRSKILGSTVAEMRQLSPTSSQYTFEEDVKIQIHFKTGVPPLVFSKHSNLSRLVFDCSKNTLYEKEIALFKLNQRYDFHKLEALRIMDLKKKYNALKLKDLSHILYDDYNHSDEILEDILPVQFKRKNHRCFSKMYSDILTD